MSDLPNTSDTNGENSDTRSGMETNSAGLIADQLAEIKYSYCRGKH